MFYVLKDRQVEPCADLYELGKYMVDIDCQVAEDWIDDTRISTVFLGVACLPIGGKAGDDRPQVFETAIFGVDNFRRIARRYATWEEAEAGHKAVVWQVLQ